jgi:L-threonylcarbamoyladenylate synthase
MEKISLVEFLKFDKLDLKGKVFCFPTDTVYGVGCLFYDNIAIDKIYTMKKRSKDKPMANLCSSISQIESLNIPIPSKAKELMKTYWPGALTIKLQDKMQTISFRMPDSLIALSMIEKFFILPTTSVNESG